MAARASISWPQACARRLDRLGLSAPLADPAPAAAAAAMCGAHAQVMTAAEWSIGLRISGRTRADVQDALWSQRSLVKTFGPRGTVHLLPGGDLPMWAGALAAVPRPRGGLPESARLTARQADTVIEAIASALAGQAALTVAELSESVIARAGPWAGDLVVPGFGGQWPRWRQVLARAGQHGAVCFGPNRGRNVTYISLRDWLPGFSPASSQPALAELVRRYLHAYGPATPAQFARWLGAPAGWAAALFDALAGQLEQVSFLGAAAWVAAGDTAVPPSAPGGIALLPYFDAYTVAGQPRELLFPGPAGQRALSPTGQAGTFPVLLIDGVAGGVWHQRRSGRTADITVEPFGSLTRPARRELDRWVQRMGAFTGVTARLTIGPVTVGRHA